MEIQERKTTTLGTIDYTYYSSVSNAHNQSPARDSFVYISGSEWVLCKLKKSFYTSLKKQRLPEKKRFASMSFITVHYYDSFILYLYTT